MGRFPRHIIKKKTEDLVSFQNNIFQMKHTESMPHSHLNSGISCWCCVQSTNNANNVEKYGFR